MHRIPSPRDPMPPIAEPRRRCALMLAAGLWGGWAAAAAAGPAAPDAALTAPLLQGLDGWRFPVETRDPRVQRYADQGVLLVYGFNPEEAARSLQAAVTLDPACASAWWALAWALGPNINSDMAPEAVPRVQHALRQARTHAARATPVRRALIEVLSLRHPPGREIDEEAYAEALQVLARRHPRDADVALLAAEALLNLHPYDWWQADGRPQPWTPAIEALLQRAMRLQPRHPGAHHYWIHLQESSPHPARARASADLLRHAHPGSGHLLHMPSHIDLRTGRFDEAVRANQRSIAADERYLAQVDAQGAYRVGYVAHNHHFLWAAAGMAGRQALALQAAQAAWPAACGPARRDPGTAIVQQYGVLPVFTLVRFGQWDTLLRGTLPPDGPAPYPLAMWHYARGTALARTGQLQGAQQALARLRAVAAEPALRGQRIKNINPATALVQIATLTLQADLALAHGEPAAAVALLREATATEDALSYDEPHLWLAPTRHALGAVLLAAGQAAAAAQVYREDLRHYPANGWSLAGLAAALRQLQQPAAAAQAGAAARAAFRGAERLPEGSRF
jgi:tetratricopeptide (TPR) repeat protein